MKSYKEQLNEVARKSSVLRMLTEEESAALKRLLVQMYQELEAFCDQHGLRIMLAGGSCLGAVRHQGFIPWDDDIDLYMPRPDYEQLKGLLLAGAYSQGYEFTFPQKNVDAPCTFMKIYKKGTLSVELGSENAPFPKSVFLDIFCLDGVPQNPLAFKCKAFTANVLRLIGNMVYAADYPMSDIQRLFYKGNLLASLNVHTRRFLGHIFGIIPHKKWVYWFDRFVYDDNMDGTLTTASGRYLYQGETGPAERFLPPVKTKFEDIQAYIPRDAKSHVGKLYGMNYMQLPPEDKRERHFILDFKL